MVVGDRGTRRVDRRGLPQTAADTTLKVVYQAKARFALKRAALGVRFGHLEAVEILLVFVFGRAGVANAAGRAAERAETQQESHGP